jgi:hypothetical protein
MPSRPAVALVAVGLLLLPGPVYAGFVDSLPPDRGPDGYGAERVDLDNPDTRTRLAETFGREVTVLLSHVTDSPPDRYRAPNRTGAVLERAYRGGGPVRITDDAVRRDVASIAANASFVRPDGDHDPRRLVLDRSGDALLVTTRETDASAVFRAVRDEVVVDYASLPPAERVTVDRVLNTTGSERAYYRPYENEPHPPFPAIVEKGGEHYLVRSTVVVDDFGPDGLFAGLLATGLGLVSLLAGGTLTFVGPRHGR